jgi:hypothetical protein
MASDGVTTMSRLVRAVSGVGELESVAVTVNAVLSTAVGVPVITPVAALRMSPLGRLPAVTAHATGAVPPAAESDIPG